MDPAQNLSLNPSNYFANARSNVYKPVPTYYDPTLAQEVPVGYQKRHRFIEGCSCAEVGSQCKPDKNCRCEGKIERDGGNICDYDRCKACKADRRRCIVRAGCECRKNASPAHVYVCNELCHSQRGLACGNKFNVAPRERSIEVVRQGGMGYGVRAKERIPSGTCIGIYSGRIRTGLECMEAAKAVHIAMPHSLGLAAYFAALSKQTKPDVPEDSGAAHSAERTSVHNIDDVLAIHLSNGQKHILIEWENHIQLTWAKDDGNLDHGLTCDGLLVDVEDDDLETNTDIGPERYGLYAGELNPLHCCLRCDEDKDNADGFDYRLYIDASETGNFTRFISHSCEPNVDVIYSRFGSHSLSPPMPLLITKRAIAKGTYLSFPYWHVGVLSNEQRKQLKKQRPAERNTYNNCQCQSELCSGWIGLPPRQELRDAGVPEEVIANLWCDYEL